MLCLSAKAQQLDVQLVPHIYTGGTHITCHGQSNGQVAAIITGGQAPYKILWSTGDTTTMIQGLSAGHYHVIVHDAVFDTLQRHITLTQPAALTVQYSRSSYNGYAVAWQSAANGQLQVLPSGGVAPYKIQWGDGDSSLIRSNLIAGNYSFTVTDAAGCAFQGAQQLYAPEALQAQVQVLQQVSCHGEEDGRAALAVNGGVPPYVYQWKNGETADTASSLAAGQQHVVVKDANQKTIQVHFQISQPEAIEVSAKAFVYANKYNTSCHNCANGKIITQVTGGNVPYSYAWYNDEEELISTESNPEQLEAGKYYLSVYDAHQCKAKSGAHILPAPRDDWSMEGNEGLDAATHFIGTTDSTALIFRTNHQEAMRIEGDGTVVLEKGLKLNTLSEGMLWVKDNGEVETESDPLAKFGLDFLEYIYAEKDCEPNTVISPKWVSKPEVLHTGMPSCPAKVGINTSQPQESLHVVGNAITTGRQSSFSAAVGYGNPDDAVANATVQIRSHSNGTGGRKAIEIDHVVGEQNDFAYSVLNKVNHNTTKAFAVAQTADNNAETFVVYGDGTTVIGTTSGNAVTPANDTKLAVYGLLSAQEVRVMLTDFPDYVFEEDYCLDELDDVADYIKENKHLPGVVSAKDVHEKGGFELGAVQLMTLEKLEELYLHVIQLNERIKALESILDNVRSFRSKEIDND